MNWLILLYFIELGYAPFYGSQNISDRYEDQNIYYINMNAEVLIFDHLFIGGAVKTYMNDTNNSYTFSPFEADYLFKTGLRFSNLEIGFKHFCLHPVRPFEVYHEPRDSVDAGYEEFYIKISGGF